MNQWINEWMNDKGRYSVLKRGIFEEMIRTCRKWAFYRIERLLDFIFKSNKTCRKWVSYRSGSRDCAAGSPPPRPPEELCWEPPDNDDWDWQWSLLAMMMIALKRTSRMQPSVTSVTEFTIWNIFSSFINQKLKDIGFATFQCIVQCFRDWV